MTLKLISQSNDSSNILSINFKNRKYIIDDKFSLDSTFGRIIGLFAYDFIIMNGIEKESVSNILEKILDSHYLTKLVNLANLFGNKDIINIEQSTIGRWLSKTSECIEKRSVLSLK